MCTSRAAFVVAVMAVSLGAAVLPAQLPQADPRLQVSPSPQARDSVKPLRAGFIGEQMRAGVRWGWYGAGVGLLAGAVALGQSDGELDAIAYPIAGAMIGYIVGAPIGVYRFSTRQGVRANPLAAAAGGLVGTLGIVGFGFPVFFTVPLGAAWAHNKARR